jgi:hypothetical protein
MANILYIILLVLNLLELIVKIALKQKNQWECIKTITYLQDLGTLSVNVFYS